MGRIKLRKALVLGAVLILFGSLFLSALGVSGLVGKYLWNRSKKDAQSVAKNVVRFLERQEKRQVRPSFTNRASVLSRNFKRFNRGPGQLLLLRNGQIVRGAEDEERDWVGIVPLLKPGVRTVDYDGLEWQVVTRDVDSTMADQVVVIRPWSPSVRVVRTLVLYQVVVSMVVLGIALFVISYFSTRLARPLEELKRKTSAIGVDQVDELETSAVVEIAQLQNSFIEMSERVEQAMNSQRRFVADASHELKTPLTAIAGMLELIQSRDDMEPSDRDQALTVARKEADRMESLIADLLLLSRAQAKRSGEATLFNLSELVAEQVDTLQVLFPDQKFLMSGDTTAEHSMNPAAFSRVARNLMENAARYAGGEPIEIVFKQEKGCVTMTVRDSGPGIPEDKQSMLFERFYRTDSGRARTEGGHGLGLAIVRALVEEGDGTIECRSNPGEGAEFRISFPGP